MTNSPPYPVLFVCLGNACRSQMAEGFARAYGSDVIVAQSAGITPLDVVPDETKRVMLEKNIDLSAHYPKPISTFRLPDFEVVINLSGFPLPRHAGLREWNVEDPYMEPLDYYRASRDHIERLVMNLILELRRRASHPSQ